MGALEHHERENGHGYPRGLTKEKISMYGKIIAVACSYEAATAPRPYKEAQDASSGIVEMIKNTNGQYDETILKALLYSLSFYPVGMYVYLSNGKIAKVIDVNPDDPRFPIVQIYGKTTPTGDPVIVQTKSNNVTIKRQLSKEELKSIDRNTV
ncbi:HD-GYP domain-containing protein [Treponema sp. B152]|uniref:HD-GYP domain-containing protein n=1 Tax=Treponema sp. B152 TaxID=2749432 RepID=UPI00353223ED